MFDRFLHYFFSTSEQKDEESTASSINPYPTTDMRVQIEFKDFLPEVSDTWSFVQKLSIQTNRFREIFDLYKYERSPSLRRDYFEQLKTLDETIYNLSVIIHQRIQTLERSAQPILDEFRTSTANQEQQQSLYTPAYIRIAQNQLLSLKLSFKRIVMEHNTISIDYQEDLKRSIERARLTKSSTILDSYQQISRATVDQMTTLFEPTEEDIGLPMDQQLQLQISKENEYQQQQEMQIADLEARLESVRILKERVRQMNEMTMALYFSVQDQNELTDNIWMNTSTGSDYIAQSVEELHLVKDLQQAKVNHLFKFSCIALCLVLLLLLILVLTLKLK